MFILLVSLALTAILIDAVALLCWKVPAASNLIYPLPFISILVPMRNEAQNVKGLIKCLKGLNYPSDKIEFLIGEDRSDDNTLTLLRESIGMDSRFKVVPIRKDIPGLKAKANVVAQLIPQCNSDFYFITDADVRVPASWAEAILSNMTLEDGVVGGPTVVKVDGLWTGLQNMDWLFAQGLLFTVGRMFQTMAVSGTNMLLTRSACEAIGGYDRIPYSLTEDIGALTAMKKQGFPGRNVLDKGALAVIDGQPDWSALISQRARWTYGALRLPGIMVLLLLIRSLFLLLVLAVALYAPVTAIILYVIKISIDLMLLFKVANVLKQTVSIWHFLLFETYWFLISTGGLIRHLFYPKTNWKGRDF